MDAEDIRRPVDTTKRPKPKVSLPYKPAVPAGGNPAPQEAAPRKAADEDAANRNAVMAARRKADRGPDIGPVWGFDIKPDRGPDRGCRDRGPDRGPDEDAADRKAAMAARRKADPWIPVCARRQCPCTGTFDGNFGSFCSPACRDGTPCKRPTHENPPPDSICSLRPTSYTEEQPGGKFTARNMVCKRDDCPCLSTFNGKSDNYCCKQCSTGSACDKNVHWTICHGTVLSCAKLINQNGFKPTPAQYGELGEGIYGTCVHPQTKKTDAKKALDEEIEKAKRFAHDYDLRKADGKLKGSTDVPVLIMCTFNFAKVKVCLGSDPEGDDRNLINGDKAKGRVIGMASQWKLDGFEACYTSCTDGARDPYRATKNSEICFKSSCGIGAMRVVRLDKNGCPLKAISRPCGYEAKGFKCPCEP